MEFNEKLREVQTRIKAPKNLYNTFGNYRYRNAEGILEAVKPYLREYNLCLTLGDEIMQVGERYYIKTTATLYDGAGSGSVSVSAYAREAAVKKGMDDSQITGTASSYARKYALNGLFLLDDTKDADTDENRIERENRSMTISKTEAKALYSVLQKHDIDVNDFMSERNIHKLSELSPEEYAQVIKDLKGDEA